MFFNDFGLNVWGVCGGLYVGVCVCGGLRSVICLFLFLGGYQGVGREFLLASLLLSICW